MATARFLLSNVGFCILASAILVLSHCKEDLRESATDPVPNTKELPVSKEIIIDSQESWESFILQGSNLDISDGQVSTPIDSVLHFSGRVSFNEVTTLDTVFLDQSYSWQNWEIIPRVRPDEADDAPVLVIESAQNYWLLSAYKGDIFHGYHAWYSSDLITWEHIGPITEARKRYVTTAEFLDGKFYIYYDFPNDEDPHLIIDEDLRDGKYGKDLGMVFNDPTHGSDIAILHDHDGFHMIYEDWTPINPRTHSWDSPLAGHSHSIDGINGFTPHEFDPPVDERTLPTGQFLDYEPHKTQLLKGKDLGPYRYEVHSGEQDAYGDYSIIKVGDEYYIFSDYDPKEEDKSMRIAVWHSSDIYKKFERVAEIGKDFHPDPTVGYAEGYFYLLAQHPSVDFRSKGPWVGDVFVRFGVDIDNDKHIDHWSNFSLVEEKYILKQGYSRWVSVLPAFLVPSIPSGYMFQIDIKVETPEKVKPIFNRLRLTITQ